jgi:hypothetical protein
VRVAAFRSVSRRLAASSASGRSWPPGALHDSDRGRGIDEEQEHRAAATIGVIRVMSASSSHEWALSGRGARGAQVGMIGSRINPTLRARPSPVVAPRAWATVNVLGSSRFRWCRAALGVVRRAGALARVSVWRELICATV